MNIFEKASRLKLRLNYKGLCSVETLWNLSVTELDGIYRVLKAKQKLIEGDSLLSKSSSKDEDDDALAIDIITCIVRAKQEETRVKTDTLISRARIDKLKEIIANKKDEELSSKTVKQLEKELSDLAK